MSKPAGMRRLFSGISTETLRLQEAIVEATEDARANPLNQGREVKDIVLPAAAATPNTVRVIHKLGRKPKNIMALGNSGGESPQFKVTEKTATSFVLEGLGAAGTTFDAMVF